MVYIERKAKDRDRKAKDRDCKAKVRDRKGKDHDCKAKEPEDAQSDRKAKDRDSVNEPEDADSDSARTPPGLPEGPPCGHESLTAGVTVTTTGTEPGAHGLTGGRLLLWRQPGAALA